MTTCDFVVKRRTVEPIEGAMLGRYEAHLWARGLMPSSIEARMTCLRRVERAIGGNLSTATLEDLRGWMERRSGLAPRTRYGNVSHLSAFFRWLVLEGHRSDDPTLRLERPKLRRGLPRPVGDEDVRRAIQQATSRELRAMIALAAFAGLRCQEIAGIERADVLERRRPPVLHVVHAKGGRERVVPIHPELLEHLLVVLPSRGPVFVTSTGRPRTPAMVSRMLREHLRRCDVDATGHQLRHWFGTAVYEASSDLRLTQELLGHASPTSTAIYTAIAQQKAAQVVSALVA